VAGGFGLIGLLLGTGAAPGAPPPGVVVIWAAAANHKALAVVPTAKATASARVN
jgi:hypothetical protein